MRITQINQSNLIKQQVLSSEKHHTNVKVAETINQNEIAKSNGASIAFGKAFVQTNVPFFQGTVLENVFQKLDFLIRKNKVMRNSNATKMLEYKSPYEYLYGSLSLLYGRKKTTNENPEITPKSILLAEFLIDKKELIDELNRSYIGNSFMAYRKPSGLLFNRLNASENAKEKEQAMITALKELDDIRQNDIELWRIITTTCTSTPIVENAYTGNSMKILNKIKQLKKENPDSYKLLSFEMIRSVFVGYSEKCVDNLIKILKSYSKLIRTSGEDKSMSVYDYNLMRKFLDHLAGCAIPCNNKDIIYGTSIDEAFINESFEMLKGIFNFKNTEPKLYNDPFYLVNHLNDNIFEAIQTHDINTQLNLMASVYYHKLFNLHDMQFDFARSLNVFNKTKK